MMTETFKPIDAEFQREPIRGFLPSPDPTVTVTEMTSRYGGKMYRVDIGDGYQDELTTGEALEIVAMFLFGTVKPRLMTKAQHHQWRRSLALPISGPVTHCPRCSRANIAQTYHAPPACGP